MRRSTLQRKDREELTTIATTLGRKPPSRARKGEIIDMIIGLASGGDPSSEPAIAEPAAATDSTVSTAEAPAEAVGNAPASSTGAQSAASSAEQKPTDSRGPKSATRRDRQRDPRAGNGSGPAKDNGNGPAKAKATGDGNGNSPAKDSGSDDSSGSRNEDGSDNGNDSAQQGDQQSTGGRRRRRRGRDRDQANDTWDGEPVPVSGILDLRNEGFGFLRVNGYLASKQDAYVPVKMVRELGLRKGDEIVGTSRPATRSEKNPALVSIESVNGGLPDSVADRPHFEDLTPLFPDERLRQEIPRGQANITARIIDLVSPIGKGQRGLIVSPPKAGKTTVMKNIIRSIETNNPEVHVIVLLVDERPEEVTDMKRWIKEGEVIASTFDRPAEEHTAVAEMTIERAKRIVETGRDVCIILDGITRLARAYNQAAPTTGRVMSGGIDSGALYPPKKFFGAARNIEEGGSLTILASALVETGSRMDEVIFEEFKGTGNMELRLDRRAAERRVYPAIDVAGSSTRHEELLFDRKELDQVWKLRRVLMGLSSDGPSGAAAGLEMLIERIGSFRNNDEFLKEIAKGPAAG